MRHRGDSLTILGMFAFLLIGAMGVEECQEQPECRDASDCGAYETCMEGQCLYVCEAEGGEVTTGLCCESVDNFPNTCLIGACGCAPEYSHEVLICLCPAGLCWDGNHCVPPPPY